MEKKDDAKLAILKKHYLAYYKGSFPEERLSDVVDMALFVKEETSAILNAMDEYAAQSAPAGAVWVKLSERLPSPANPPVLIPVKRYEADPTQYSVRAMTANQLADIIKWDQATFEWLDESGAEREVK
jgi:hypothetical protein